MKPHLFLDLDGCLADFDTAVDKFWPGHTRDSVKLKDFWKPLSEVPNFFYKLKVLHDCRDMYNNLKNEGWKIEILTALPIPTGYFSSARDDKTKWVHEFIDQELIVHTVLGGKNKTRWLVDKPGSILVDDYKRNIDLWNADGGIGILHETGNSQKTYRELQKYA